jgi:hypothetical protein
MEAWAKAQARLSTKGRGKTEPAMVDLYPEQIKTRPELFQPREFSFGLHGVDRDHVKRLKRAIETTGELDPPLVIKTGGQWICVDGHHRIAAYQAAKWNANIKCEWFGGDVKEASAESMSRNKKDRLNVPQADRLEEAWKRVLLGWGSKAEIASLCGVSERSVATMRHVKATATDKDDFAREFRSRLGGKLDETSWAQVKLIFAGVEPQEISDETRAAKLAKRINARLTNLLSREPSVTARALMIYDPELPGQLMEAWGKPPSRAVALNDENEGHALPER